MEEETQLPTQRINNEEEEEGVDEEFYEKIEAPKFVDLTVPDPYRPDDRYWFCLRVGCDQKHEEEMDAEAIYKKFVLRVMAARSPNIRLRKALYGKNLSTNVKCPLSAPAKSSKSRVSKLAMVSSISQKMVDAKAKVRLLPKLGSTPMAKSKQVAAKYMTTPRNKRCLPNPNSFRSIQNPKPTTIAVPKNRMVAKALVFHSPKKTISMKSSFELRTPLTKICEGMKRLDIASQRKRVLGYSSKSSKEIKCDPKKSLPVDPSRRQLSSRKGKGRVKDLLQHQNCEDQEAKSLRSVKNKSQQKLNKQCRFMSKERVENDSSDMEIDVKSRDGSVSDISRINEGNGHEEQLKTVKTSGNFGTKNSTQEVFILSSEVPPTRENSGTSSSDASVDLPRFQALNGDGDSGSEGIEQENNSKSISENEGSAKDLLAAYQTLEGAEHKSEVMDSDDKENTLASDDNRDFNRHNNHSGRELLGKQETHKNDKKAAQTLDKKLKHALSSTATGAQEVKYRKPKPTNPKPFRLRTDERGILKEANLERKIRFLAPPKEPATVSRFPCSSSQRIHGNDIQRNEKCEQSKCDNDVLGGSRKELETNIQKKESRRTAVLKTPRGQVRPKIATITPERRFESIHRESKPRTSPLNSGKDNVSQKAENSLRKARSPSLQRQLASPQGVASTKNAIAPGPKLSVIKETSSKTSKLKEARKVSDSGATAGAEAAATAGFRSSSRGRRHVTIPKEPNFHSTHLPKTCISKMA